MTIDRARLGLALASLVWFAGACGGKASGPTGDAGGALDSGPRPSADSAVPRDGAPIEGGATDAPSGDANTCDAPSQVTYSCTPITTDGSAVAGCRGGPTQAGAPDPGDVFPMGCTATLAMCAADFPGEAQTCMCGQFPSPDGGTLTWICPL